MKKFTRLVALVLCMLMVMSGCSKGDKKKDKGDKTSESEVVAEETEEPKETEEPEEQGPFLLSQTGYDEAGNVVSVRTLDYDERNHLINETTVDGEGNLISEYIFTYDENNTMVYKKVTSGGDVKEYNLDANGNLLKEYYVYASGKTVIKENTYDANGNNILHVQTSDPVNEVQDCRIECTYDDKNRIVTKTSYDAYGALYKYCTYEYEDNGNYKEYVYDESYDDLTDIVYYEFDEFGNRTARRNECQYAHNAGHIPAIYLATYDTNYPSPNGDRRYFTGDVVYSRILSGEIYSASYSGESLYSLYQYEYNDDGSYTVYYKYKDQLDYDFWPNQESYNAEGRLLLSETFYADGALEYHKEYNGKGVMMVDYTYDETGALINSSEYTVDENNNYTKSVIDGVVITYENIYRTE